MDLKFLLFLIFLTAACVKEEGKVLTANNAGGTTGTTGGGGTTTGTSGSGTDPLASEAWHLDNNGQTAFSALAATSGEDIDATYVHQTMDILGRGVKVAVSDTGVQTNHPDLSGNGLSTEHRNYTFSNPSYWHGRSPEPSDNEAHGTAVTGLISALGWNGIGSRGVAPSSKFGAFRFVYEASASETEASYLAKLLDQFYGDFDVFNYSYGFDGRLFMPSDDTIEEALELGVTQLRSGKGVLYVQSAGNSYNESYTLNICDPACANVTMNVTGNANSHADLATPYKIIVGATNASRRRASYSSPGSNLWVSAPGGEDGVAAPAMISTDIQSCSTGMSYTRLFSTLFNFGGHAQNPKCDYTNIMNGTSSAAPVVSGVVALMLEANRYLTWRDVKHILAVTADPIDFDVLPQTHPDGYNLSGHIYDYKWVTNRAGISFSNWYGFGRVNARDAVEMATTYDLTTLGSFEQTKNSQGLWYYDSGDLAGKEILDENPVALEDKIWVGHNFVIENVQIKITTDHVFPGDLSIVLESPLGTESRLLNLNSKIYAEADDDGITLDDFPLASNAFYGEESEGFWTIKIVDGNGRLGSGNLLRWKILINGHREASELTAPYPPTEMSFSSVPATSDRTPVFAFASSTSHSSLLRYEASVERDSDGAVIKSWTNIGLNDYGHQLTGLSLVSGTLYNLKIRAVGPGGHSSVQLKQWMAN